MTIYDLKPAFQNLLRPLCRVLARDGVTANQITVAALLGSIIVGFLFGLSPTSAWATFLIPIWLFLRMALNAIDGMLAREHNMQSELGGILNELGDGFERVGLRRRDDRDCVPHVPDPELARCLVFCSALPFYHGQHHFRRPCCEPKP